jgi:hypothetical protein
MVAGSDAQEIADYFKAIPVGNDNKYIVPGSEINTGIESNHLHLHSPEMARSAFYIRC